MSNVEQEADNSKRNSEESDVVLKNQQMSKWYPDSRKAEVAKLDKQTQATAHPIVSYNEPAVAIHPFASFAYPDDKETTVARSVVTKNEQQLSEQLLNNQLENIQPFNAINAQDGRING
ncbi:type I inositol 1,4,5-trisphosphate 5-phosphatase 12-like [Dorcoceras hygrometricum]|uniref:Type I inositol 1,4,5-trisphosphate 5-phosphatase 12-like n=1 Tax=Dorcoceras hygrometricum TaxID=472368 RepID=A0A2Z7BX97_9LAMI|nr:type I inositol 1,4,5-trisphosphate 5-phosphatase 12-like [Dorcoceras hygrometricum]